MASKIYKTLAAIVGTVLALAGIGALIGGNFASSFIKDQMDKQDISMPTGEALDGQVKGGRISQETADKLRPYVGQKMTNGDQAYAYSQYIGDHMAAGAKAMGKEGATYESLGADVNAAKEKLTAALKAKNPTATEDQLKGMVTKEMKNPATTYPEAQEAAKLQGLRMDTFFTGSTLQGTLLNVYGWGLVGKIASIAGWILLPLGLLMLAWGLIGRNKKHDDDVVVRKTVDITRDANGATAV